MAAPDVLAIDWGTTNRRVYRIDAAGTVVETRRDDRGVLAVAADGFAGEVAAIRAEMGDLPVVCAGMVGSVRGWREVPYRSCPADLDDLAAGAVWVEPGRTAIVPGVSVVADGRGDVMRGEEVQLLGAVAAGSAPPDALLCQPGTHCKWARIAGGRIAGVRTAMTGELFALLKRGSLLADFLGGAVVDGPAFRAGLETAREGALLTRLFTERADVLLGLRDAADTAAHVSGLLIGTDVREQDIAAGETVHLLSDDRLGPLYVAAIEAAGARAARVDSHAAFVSGIHRIWRAIHAQSS